MTTCTNHRLVVGIVCLLMNLSGLAAAQAPQSPEAFYELVEGRRMDVTIEEEDEPALIRFIAPGRHSTRLESHEPFREGDYTYESTGAATGTLVLTLDVVDNRTDNRLEFELTFESMTAGTVLVTSFLDGRAEEGGDFPATFQIVDVTDVPALPGLAALLLAALLLVASRLRQSSSSAPSVGRG
ncbi:MAG: hypothetical protein OXF27_20105 [Acidobacteria bacterium]|nr:hypothetical protein [Acidobacteriota bacterium]